MRRRGRGAAGHPVPVVMTSVLRLATINVSVPGQRLAADALRSHRARGQAATLGTILELDDDVVHALGLPPVRGRDVVDTSEPIVYRLQEMVQVYGSTIAELVREEFGDGIVSAVDFEMDLVRVPDPKGDRVRITLNGKFLPYRSW